jgi:hypothetical protein
MSENLLLKECLDTFFRNLAEDTSFPKDLLATLKALRASSKLTKGDNLKDVLTAYKPANGTKP